MRDAMVGRSCCIPMPDVVMPVILTVVHAAMLKFKTAFVAYNPTFEMEVPDNEMLEFAKAVTLSVLAR